MFFFSVKLSVALFYLIFNVLSPINLPLLPTVISSLGGLYLLYFIQALMGHADYFWPCLLLLKRSMGIITPDFVLILNLYLPFSSVNLTFCFLYRVLDWHHFFFFVLRLYYYIHCPKIIWISADKTKPQMDGADASVCTCLGLLCRGDLFGLSERDLIPV